MASLSFNANEVAPAEDYAPLPAGDYTVAIIDSSMQPTKTGRGQYLQLTMQVLDGPSKGRLIWDRLTLVHDNNQAVEIAQRKLSAICHAVNVLQVSDSSQLHDKPLLVRLKYVEAKDQYGPKNEVGSYKAISAATATPRPAQVASAVPAAHPPSQYAQTYIPDSAAHRAPASTPPWG